MTKSTIFAGLLTAASAALPVSGPWAGEAPPVISYAQGDALSPRDLANRSFDQIAAGFTDKQIAPPKKWMAHAAGEPDRLLEAEFAQPPEAVAPGMCRANKVIFTYVTDGKLPSPPDADAARAAFSVHADAIQLANLYAIVGPIGKPGDKRDADTISACAKLTAFSPGFFRAASNSGAYQAAMLLADAKSLAAAPSPEKFSFSCIGEAAYCMDTREMLAKLDLHNIEHVEPCVTNFDDPPKERCEVIQITPHPKKIRLDGPNDWYVKIESAATGMTVQMKPVPGTMFIEAR